MNKYVVIAILSILIAGCQADDKDFKRHGNGDGPKVKAGDIVSFTITVSTDKDTMQVNNDESMLPTVRVGKDPKEYAGDIVVRALSKCRVGDSISITLPVDSFPKQKEILAGKKFVYYGIRVKETRDSLSYVKFIEKKKAEMEAEAKTRMAVDVNPVKEDVAKTLAAYKANQLSNIKTTNSGLKYLIKEEGKGPVAKAGQSVKVDYYGVLTSNGENFDASIGRERAFEFAVGKGSVIKGWEEAFQLLPAGSKAYLFIPSALGYGETPSGPIPANSELMFYVELFDKKK